MKFVTLCVLPLLASLVSAFHVEPPSSITTCGPMTVAYDTRTGVAPFYCTFHNETANGPVLWALDSDDITGTSYTAEAVPIVSGYHVVVVLSDSAGKSSATLPITVGQGSSDSCLSNYTPSTISPVPSVTVTYSATTLPASYITSGSGTPSGSGTSSGSGTPSSVSLPSGVSSSLSSISGVISSANSVLSSLTRSTSTPLSSPTSGLGTNGGVSNVAGVFTIGAFSAIVGAFLA